MISQLFGRQKRTEYKVRCPSCNGTMRKHWQRSDMFVYVCDTCGKSM